MTGSLWPSGRWAIHWTNGRYGKVWAANCVSQSWNLVKSCAFVLLCWMNGDALILSYFIMYFEFIAHPGLPWSLCATRCDVTICAEKTVWCFQAALSGLPHFGPAVPWTHHGKHQFWHRGCCSFRKPCVITSSNNAFGDSGAPNSSPTYLQISPSAVGILWETFLHCKCPKPQEFNILAPAVRVLWTSPK